jgi:uncharacterized membrane protein YkgB
MKTETNLLSSNTEHNASLRAQPSLLAPVLIRIGTGILRYGLVIVLLWIGGMKFTAYEAAGIAPFETHSPLMSWAYHLLGQRNLSDLLGVIEITLGLGIALRQVMPRISGIASLVSVGMFLTTLTFLFTTPGWEPTLEARAGQRLRAADDYRPLGRAESCARACGETQRDSGRQRDKQLA